MADVILYFEQGVPQGEITSLKELEGVDRIRKFAEKGIQVFFDYNRVTVVNLLNRLRESDKVRVIGL